MTSKPWFVFLAGLLAGWLLLPMLLGGLGRKSG